MLSQLFLGNSQVTKEFAIDFMKGVLAFIFSLLAPIILVIVGALIAGFGFHKKVL
jgi:hypothetical protein